MKLLRRLHARRTREREGCFAVEGEDLVAAGLAAGRVPRFVLADADAIGRSGGRHAAETLQRAREAGAACAAVEPALLAADSQLAHHARLIGVFDLPAITSEVPSHQPALVLDGIRDPGNVGTLTRTALMLGVDHVVLGHGTADPWGPKAARASMGAVFYVSFVTVQDLPTWLEAGARAGRAVVGLDPDGDLPLAAATMGKNPLLCVGSERDGLSGPVRERCSSLVAIEQAAGHAGRPDSLNAAIAGGILLYEWSRTRA